MFKVLLSLSCLWLAGESVAIGDDQALTAEQKATASERALRILKNIAPSKGGKENTAQIVEGHYVLWGELFEPGRVVAVVDLSWPHEPPNALRPGSGESKNAPCDIVMAVWRGDHWSFSDAWLSELFWRTPGLPEDEVEFLPAGLPDKPFWTLSLRKDLPPLLIASIPHSRYRGGHIVYWYDPASHRLQPTSGKLTVAEPQRRGEFIVLTDDSGRKAWWGEDRFYRFDRKGLSFRGGIRTGGYVGDDSLIQVTFIDPATHAETIWRFYAGYENPSKYKIFLGDESEPKPEKLGEMAIEANQDSGVCAAYLFQRLTGLPSSLIDRELWAEGKLKEGAKLVAPAPPVKVTGNEAVKKKLLPTK